MAKNPRIPITLSKEMKEYFEEESKRTGLSQSALIVIMLRKQFDRMKKERLIWLDSFECYLFEKIVDFKKRLVENEGNKEVEWLLNNCIEQFMEILSEYDLNYKYDLGA